MTSRSFPYVPGPGIPGAYCDALPTGEFVAYIPNERCETHLGRIEFLDRRAQPLFPSINPVRPFEFAAVAWDGPNKDRIIVWDGAWHVTADVACGVNPVIYDNNGIRYVSRCQEGVGSQGYRYVTADNRLVTGDATYSPTSTILLSEWTQLLPDLEVGQGRGDDGVHVMDGDKLRALSINVGLCRFVHARILGNLVSVAWWGQGTHTAEFRWLTVDELRALPLVTAPPIIILPPVPPPPPPPVEVLPMTLHSDVIALFRRYLTVFPVPNGAAGSEEHFTAMRVWMRRFCEQVRFSFPDGMPGVGGEFGWKRASTGRPESKESLALQTSGGLGCWDLFRDVGLGNPHADFSPDFHDIWNPPEGPQVFIPVTPTDHLSNPGVVTPPTPGRATVVGPWMCFSGFNLLERTDAEQDAWLNHFPRGTIHRVMLARSKRVDGRTDTSWTPTDGLNRLPALLAKLRIRKHRLHLTMHCDTKLYGHSRDQIREFTRQTKLIIMLYPDVMAVVQGFNEPQHETQEAYCLDEAFNAELEAVFPLSMPYTWGPTTHGGLVGGSFGTIHGDRNLTPEENAQYAADLKERYLREFVDDEPLGIAETDQPGRRTNDPDFARRLARAALDRGLLGATLHWEAGLTADAAMLDEPIHREALRQFLGEFGQIPEVGVTPEQIAQVLAGAFFEDITTLLGLSGTEADRRDRIHAWSVEWLTFIDFEYRRIFSRPLELEGAGSRLLLAINGWTRADMTAMLEAAYRDGAR